MEKYKHPNGHRQSDAGLASPSAAGAQNDSSNVTHIKSSVFANIECDVAGNRKKSAVLPTSLVREIEGELNRKLTEDDVKEILLYPSLIKGIENKLNENKPAELEELKRRRLTEAEVRQVLTSNGVIESSIIVNNTKTFYLEAGDMSKETVLLIHGGGNSASYKAWKYQILELAENYHVISPDLPGFGNTPKPKEKCTLEYYVKNFMGKFMDSVHIEKASIVSSSMGGWIALGFTLENPERVDKLVGIGSGGLSDKQIPLIIRELTLFPKLSKFLIDKLHKNEKLVKKVIRALTGEKDVSEKFYKMTDHYLESDGFTPAFLEFLNDQLQSSPREVAADYIKHKRENVEIMRGFRTVYLNSFETLNKANIPYLLAHGEKDPIFTLPSIEYASEKLEHCTLVKFDCMHGPHLEIPHEFNPVLMAFLADGREVHGGDHRHWLKGIMRNISDKIKHAA